MTGYTKLIPRSNLIRKINLTKEIMPRPSYLNFKRTVKVPVEDGKADGVFWMCLGLCLGVM